MDNKEKLHKELWQYPTELLNEWKAKRLLIPLRNKKPALASSDIEGQGTGQLQAVKGIWKKVNWERIDGIGLYTGELANLTVIDWDSADTFYLDPASANVKTRKGYHLWCDYNEHISGPHTAVDGSKYDIKSKGAYVELVSLTGSKTFQHAERANFDDVKPIGHGIKTAVTSDITPVLRDVSNAEYGLLDLVSKGIFAPFITHSYLSSLGWSERYIDAFVKDVRYQTEHIKAQGIEEDIASVMLESWVIKTSEKLRLYEIRQNARYRAYDCWRRLKGAYFQKTQIVEQVENTTMEYDFDYTNKWLEVGASLTDANKQTLWKYWNNQEVNKRELDTLRRNIRRNITRLDYAEL